MNKPRFVIKPYERTKYSSAEKLQMFVELACYVKHPDDFVYLDASDASNKIRAEKWFEDELWFLGKRDAAELRDFWNLAIEDGDNTRTLFAYIHLLQKKYV